MMDFRSWESDYARRRALGYFLAQVVAARDSERSQSLGPKRADDLYRARVRTLHALVDYAGLIESLGWPVPRGVSRDIMLYRSLCGPTVGCLYKTWRVEVRVQSGSGSPR